jgi:outer membrane receptor for ferrienterochelin and colicins
MPCVSAANYQKPAGRSSRRLELRAERRAHPVLEGDSTPPARPWPAPRRARQDDHNENRDRQPQRLAAKLNLQTDRRAQLGQRPGGSSMGRARQPAAPRSRTALPKPGLSDFGEDVTGGAHPAPGRLHAERVAGHARSGTLHGGLRYEADREPGRRRPRCSDARRRAQHLAACWSPIAHALWKPDPKGQGRGRNQLRMSLTRSYRAANLGDLIARPSINSQIPSGPNTVATARPCRQPDC